MINHDAALAYLDYYGEDAMGFSIVSPRVRRGACARRAAVATRRRIRLSGACPAARLTASRPQNLVVMTVREKRPGGVHVIASQSVSDALGPPPPRNSVRARLVSAGGVVMPSPAGGCDVMFMTQARPSRLRKRER